jgi:thioredoxin-like negative regulator of GroEL
MGWWCNLHIQQMKKFLYFTAAWCGPCKVLKPKIEALSNELPITILDVDANQITATQYSVRNIPTVIMIDETGTALNRLIGNQITVDAIKELYN